MNFCFSKKEIENKEFQIVLEEKALAGVKRVAYLVASDIEKVLGIEPEINFISDEPIEFSGKVLVCTVGQSDLLKDERFVKKVDIAAIEGKREVYSFKLVSFSEDAADAPTLVIVGSDKRGTIYGLFHLSELMGVSPLVNWNFVYPTPKDEIVLTSEQDYVSKEPSVKYRGFFINDEWPAFGNWCNERFGGFNAKCYEQIFELLLRCKGNYLWPAMWSAVFSEDGPGLDNAYLADELGVVMGMSHHEPCLRNGEEYSHVRGKDSIYGDAWNFRSNEAGITKFWEDGLKRNGKFENVITVGMRGEADSTIMGKDATLKDNIDLLRDVLKCQNRLIKEIVNDDLDSVPRMLALYKEVEPFYYGDENTEGLKTSPELDGVTLMLCDDNFGNLRTVPSEEMKSHKGGFGMYYHFDYHGWPVSYEWINSSFLPKVWEQMTYAYEAGIRELWIVNVGDVFTQEYPLSFFLDLAYDYDKWGINNKDAAEEYTRAWVKTQFGGWIDENLQGEVFEKLIDYTSQMYKRRPEAMNDDMYGKGYPTEAFADSICLEMLMKECERLYGAMPETVKFPFFQFVYYPLMGTLNVRKMWADTAINHYLARIGAREAVKYSTRVKDAIDFDRQLIERLHTEADGRWYGMGMSEHIGFRNWNEEECRYPIVYEFEPTNKKRVVGIVPETFAHTEGGDWTKRELKIDISADCGSVVLYSCSDSDSTYEIQDLTGSLFASEMMGTIPGGAHTEIKVSLDEDLEAYGEVGGFIIALEGGYHIPVKVYHIKESTIQIPAYAYSSKTTASTGEYQVVVGVGIKAFPVAEAFEIGSGPSVKYEFDAPCDGEYQLDIYMTPGNPPYMDQKLLYGFQFGDGDCAVNNAVADGFKIGDDQDGWMQGVLENRRINSKHINCKAGKNTFTLSAISPNVTFSKFVLTRIDRG